MIKLKKNKEWIIALVVILIGYGIFITLDSIDYSGERPVISFELSNMEVSVNDDESILLNGVHAEDKEDGNLDEEIVIESISPFDREKNRIVTYAVFDSDQNVTKAQRKIHYNDYIKSKFYLKRSFTSDTKNVTMISNMIGATSCVDGDISGNVVTDMSVEEGTDNIHVKVSVKDSTGETSKLELNYTYDNNNYTTDVKLNSYLVYVKKGKNFDAEKNIKSIDTKSVGKSEAKNYLNIDDSKVNYNQTGTYEISYTFNYYGDTGYAKCIVVVE